MNANVIWMTGLSGSGKSTISDMLKVCLQGCVVLDGDVVRSSLCSDLGFSLADREENIRRIASVSKILVDNGIDVIVPVISPTKNIRDLARSIIKDYFVLVWVKCPLQVCVGRDVKGLYKKAINGEINNFTGISSPYECPDDFDVVCDTSEYSVERCVNFILKTLNRNIRVSH